MAQKRTDFYGHFSGISTRRISSSPIEAHLEEQTPMRKASYPTLKLSHAEAGTNLKEK